MPTGLFLCSFSKQAVFNLGSFLGKLDTGHFLILIKRIKVEK